MNVHDIPMVLFTVVSQLAVGTFITLGVLRLLASRRHDARTVERVVSPVLYAIGPAMVFGLAVSMLHMNDITHTFNVIRHWDSSWLSREIIFGVSFAAFGFVFALLEWFKVGSFVLRQIIAGVTAVLGVGLVVAQSAIYYVLITVPAWHSWAVPVQFFGTTILLGVLAVGAALMVTTLVRARADERAAAPDVASDPQAGDDAETVGTAASADAPRGGLMLQVRTRVREINAPTSSAEWELTAAVLRGIAFVGSAAAVALLVVYPLYLGALAQAGAAGQESVAILVGPMLWVRLLLLAVTAVILSFFVYRMAGTATVKQARTLVVLVLVSFVLSFASEFLGRPLHYAIMTRVGI